MERHRVVVAACRLGAFVVLFLLFAGPASASCAKKSQLVDSLVERLVDLSTTSDFNQATRDRDVIREDTIAIHNADCVNASSELKRFSNLSLTLHDDLSALKDYYDNEAGMSSMPIEQKIFRSVETQDSVHCRCYARDRALSEIFIDLNGLVDSYANLAMTGRESKAVYAWLHILDNDLYGAVGIRLKSVDVLSGVAVRTAYGQAASQLRKHCKISLYKTVAYPGNCKFTDYDAPSGAPSPSPMPSSVPTPATVPGPQATL